MNSVRGINGTFVSFKSLNLDYFRIKQEGHYTLLTVLNINQVLIL